MKSISNFRSQKFLVIAFVLLSLFAGCASLSMQEQMEAQFYATAYAKDGVIPPPKYQTLAATAMGMYLPASTPTPNPNWTPTMSFYDFSGTQVAQQQAIGMTQQANDLQMERERLAAEHEAALAATQAFYKQETAVAYSQQQTAEARVWFAQQTAFAEGTAMMSTAQAQATATMWQYEINQQDTAVAAAATAQVLPTHAIWTQDAVHALATIEQGEADQVALAVRRTEMSNFLKAYGLWAAIFGGIWIVGRMGVEWVRTRVHTRDEYGRVPLIQMRAGNGDTIVIKPELMEGPTMKIQKDGAIVRYSPMDAQEQSDINRRAAAIEAIAALPTPYAQSGAKIITSEFNSTRARVTIGSPASMGPVIDEAERGFLEDAKNE